MLLLSSTHAFGCYRDQRVDGDTSPALPTEPVRGAVGDADLRVMVTELVAVGACERIRGHFQGLRASSRPDVVSGVLWLRDCRVVSSGTKVAFELVGNGWQWVEEKSDRAGGTFAVKQYVRFGMTTKMSGEIDIGYDRESHVASVWFSPDSLPEVTFTPIGGVEVDAEGVWSSVIGGVSSLVSSSPEEAAEDQVDVRGAAEMKREFSRGISATVDLCTGLTRAGLGQTAKGKMRSAGVGESRKISVELQPGGVMIIGPLAAPKGMTVDVAVSSGAARIELVCNDAAEAVARAFMQGDERPTDVPVLASKDLRGSGTVTTSSPQCPVTLVAHALPAQDGHVRATLFSWRRPPLESAWSTGGPLIDCAAHGSGVRPSSSTRWAGESRAAAAVYSERERTH